MHNGDMTPLATDIARLTTPDKLRLVAALLERGHREHGRLKLARSVARIALAEIDVVLLRAAAAGR